MTRACGNDDCSTSTGVCGSLTFGRGKLDPDGYWEYPCKVCEDSFFERNPNFYGLEQSLMTVKQSFSNFMHDLDNLAAMDKDEAKRFLKVYLTMNEKQKMKEIKWNYRVQARKRSCIRGRA